MPQQTGREPEIQVLFVQAFQQVAPHALAPEVEVRFYPFAGLNHTIRMRQKKALVRISDIFCEAPLTVLSALAHILVRKLYRKRPLREWETHYQQFIALPHIQQASEQSRQVRGRKRLQGSHGTYFDLTTIFWRLNAEYFDNQLTAPILSWSPNRARRILGHHDAVHDVIMISRVLDGADVPAYVIEYVMYHEMLHLQFPPRMVNQRRCIHSAEFRAAERAFAQYDAALAWLAQASRRRRTGRSTGF